MLLFYMRHGDPIYHPDSLTEQGREQAAALAKRLVRYGIDKIYSSSSTRAIQTAEPTSQLVNKEIIPLDWCHETLTLRELGVPVDGKNRWLFLLPEYKKLLVSNEMMKLGHKWWSHPDLLKFNYQKGYERIRKNTYQFLEELGYSFDEETGAYKVLRDNQDRVALFAHQGFGFAFLSVLLNIPYPMICTKFELRHSGMTVISFENEDGICVPKVLTMSNDSHIYHEGLSTKYNRSDIYF